MQSKAISPEEYISKLPDDRKEYFEKLRKVILGSIPEGFEEMINYGVIGYLVPKSIYPKGYHCTPDLPLPFINIGNQKNYIALYHMGIYADKELLKWFSLEYKKVCKYKLDMGKCCIRFKRMDDIPYNLIGKLARKISMKDRINLYEKKIVK